MADDSFRDALVLTGGGTGGHFFPAVALAEAARARWPERRIRFVGARRGIEARKLSGSPWPHLLLDLEGFRGRAPHRALRALWKLAAATLSLRRRFKDERPWAVVGTGGYAAAPALLAARSLGIPYFLHESNASPGALVKLLAAGARRVWCGMEGAVPRLPGADARVVGTPVRAAFLRDFRPVAELRPPFRLLVMGGSGGAQALNAAVEAIAPALLEAHPDWEFQHQTGAMGSAGTTHPRHARTPFIDAVDVALEASSLVLCRAGALTCAELRASGRPALLVPLPTSAGDHQRHNALAMAQEGRGLVLEQGAGFPERLRVSLARLMDDPAARAALAKPERNVATAACLADLEERAAASPRRSGPSPD